MKQAMKSMLLWWYLLTKRLYKKATFLVMLVLVPLVALGYSMINTDDSGIMTIALSSEQAGDAYAAQVMEELMTEGQLIRYVVCDTPVQAENAVRTGQCDAAWIFTADLSTAVKAYGADPDDEQTLVRVMEREENVGLRLAREKLEGKLYECYAPYVFLSTAREQHPETAQWSDEELLTYYRETEMDNEALFSFAQLDMGGLKSAVQETHYLMSPIRGLLGVIILLCGLATAMYYIADSKRGTFSWMPERRRPLAEFGCQTVSVLQLSVVALVSLVTVGTAAVWWRELIVLLLYTLAVAAFCMLLRRLCGTIRVLGAMLPLVVVLSLLVCPVFFDLNALHAGQWLLPTSYYINAVYNDLWLLMMPLYSLCCVLLYWLCGKLLKRN